MMASSLVGLPPMGIISDIFSWICWNILTARNNLLFENRPISASTTMMNAISGAREWLVAQELSKPLCHILPLCRPPTHLPQDFTPCNSDRAWTGDSLTAGLGWIIHCDRVGQQIQGSSSCDFISSPLLVEAIALKMTLLAAHSYFISKVWIRSDSKGLIRAINSKTYSMELFGVLTNIERDLWQSIRGLDLEFNGSTDFDKFSFFNRFIDENSEVCLQRIKLRYVRYEDNTYNETTIDTASKQKIQHLDVGYVDPKRRKDVRLRLIKIPPTIYTSCEKLVSLKLYRATLPTPL
ncbi:hypothetical protein F2Q69_00063235, partial [Brassica cretica]